MLVSPVTQSKSLYHPPTLSLNREQGQLYVKSRNNYYLAEGRLARVAKCYAKVRARLFAQEDQTDCARAASILAGFSLMLASCCGGVAPWTFLAWMGYQSGSTQCLECTTPDWKRASDRIKQACETIIRKEMLQPVPLTQEKIQKSEIIELPNESADSTAENSFT